MRRHVIRLVLLCGLALLVGSGASAQPPGTTPTHQHILDAIANVQTAVNNLPTSVDLSEIPPTWSKTLPANERFVSVMSGAAVLDKETGLVWEQSPGTTDQIWIDATLHCIDKNVGGRKGWRLPSVHELASLVDPSTNRLPTGHPFSNVQSSRYWSATTVADRSLGAWNVGFDGGPVGNTLKAFPRFVWCVRGGSPGPDVY